MYIVFRASKQYFNVGHFRIQHGKRVFFKLLGMARLQNMNIDVRLSCLNPLDKHGLQVSDLSAAGFHGKHEKHVQWTYQQLDLQSEGSKWSASRYGHCDVSLCSSCPGGLVQSCCRPAQRHQLEEPKQKPHSREATRTTTSFSTECILDSWYVLTIFGVKFRSLFILWDMWQRGSYGYRQVICPARQQQAEKVLEAFATAGRKWTQIP